MKLQLDKRIWTKNFTILFIGNFLSQMGNYLTHSLLPLYCKSVGASDKLVAAVNSLFFFIALILRPVTGPVIDSWNRKKLFITLIFMNAICMFGYGITGNIQGIVVFRILNGVSYGASAALCLAMATADLDKAVLATGVATYTLSQMLPQAVGPAMGLFLSENFGYPVTYFISGLLMVLGALMGFRLDYTGFERKKLVFNLRSMIAWEAVVPMLLLMFTSMGYNCIGSFFAIMVQARKLGGLSAYYVIFAVTMIILRPVCGKLADRFGAERVLPVTIGTFIGCLLLMSRCNSTFEVLLSGVLQGIGYSCTQSLLQSLAIKMTPAERRGAASSSCYIGMDLGYVLAGVFAGSMAEAKGYPAVFVMGAGFEVACLAFFIIWNMIRSRRENA